MWEACQHPLPVPAGDPESVMLQVGLALYIWVLRAPYPHLLQATQPNAG